MSPEQVYRMFIRHNSTTMLAWAFFPPELFDEFSLSARVRSMSSLFTWYNIVFDGQDVIMSFDDASFYYRHRLDNWRLWLSLNRIVGPDFDIVIEVVEQAGIMFKLRLTRIPHSPRTDLGHYVFFNFLRDYVRVPDIYTYIEDDRVVYNVAPRILVNRIMNQALKVPEINANSIHTLATSCCTRIDVADTVVNKFVDVDAMELDSIVYSICLMVSAHRYKRSDVFSRCIKEYHADYDASHSIIAALKRRLLRCYESLKNSVSSYFVSSSPGGVYDLQVYPYAPIHFQLEHEVHYRSPAQPVQEDDIAVYPTPQAIESEVNSPHPDTVTSQSFDLSPPSLTLPTTPLSPPVSPPTPLYYDALDLAAAVDDLLNDDPMPATILKDAPSTVDPPPAPKDDPLPDPPARPHGLISLFFNYRPVALLLHHYNRSLNHPCAYYLSLKMNLRPFHLAFVWPTSALLTSNFRMCQIRLITLLIDFYHHVLLTFYPTTVKVFLVHLVLLQRFFLF